MPLNIKDGEEIQGLGNTKPQPLLHKPSRKRPMPVNTFMVVFFILVIASIIFLTYYLTSMRKQPPPPAQQMSVVEAPETTGTQAGRQPEVTASETRVAPAAEPPAQPPPKTVEAPALGLQPEKAAPKTPPVGDYTLVVASYSSRDPAADEVQRWNEAGYIAVVVEKDSRFRVAVGQFASAGEAQKLAHKLEIGLENGYWIGKLH